MKKWIRALALMLSLTMLLSVTALALGENEKATITDKATGATATFDSSNSEIIRVTFSSASLTAGQQYLVLMVKGSEGDYTITDKTILYIDQTAAAADEGGGNPSVSFQVYPSSIQDSVILIAGVGVNGEAGPLVAAIVDAKYILGDVNGDGIVTSADAVMALRAVVGLEVLSEKQMLSANVDGQIAFTSADAPPAASAALARPILTRVISTAVSPSRSTDVRITHRKTDICPLSLMWIPPNISSLHSCLWSSIYCSQDLLSVS